ncbi:hypothetical protein COU56_04040 [Candidatus Pacearchaeota archaeon CG10_big_fil_rev_8_21_14_0_10_31_9]|nr:MAG: hypothetical protein AUJ62_00135 [Candidatus Pacearchaeota archaeon CG1_02_32_21]PIN92723.1 MAG: hypothetical protein COU56_04040 [Candidatus Pacearchaeota archaeon CG10_big_fil_rev_8_21_14_0_10_31_9]PIZ82826.1 MAG: hypothetical protein COX97_02915 [Candidatus Pacearchaeota archaeon CG_4_10_14_0_2_um_filter_05_32_18]
MKVRILDVPLSDTVLEDIKKIGRPYLTNNYIKIKNRNSGHYFSYGNSRVSLIDFEINLPVHGFDEYSPIESIYEFSKLLLIISKDMKEKYYQEFNNTSVDNLEISVRLSNVFKRLGIMTGKDMLNMDYQELLKVKGFGKVCQREFKNILNDYGVRQVRTF